MIKGVEVTDNMQEKLKILMEHSSETYIIHNHKKYDKEHIKTFLWWIENRPCMKNKIACSPID